MFLCYLQNDVFKDSDGCVCVFSLFNSVLLGKCSSSAGAVWAVERHGCGLAVGQRGTHICSGGCPQASSLSPEPLLQIAWCFQTPWCWGSAGVCGHRKQSALPSYGDTLGGGHRELSARRCLGVYAFCTQKGVLQTQTPADPTAGFERSRGWTRPALQGSWAISWLGLQSQEPQSQGPGGASSVIGEM